jgi:hypothetical protein
MIKILKWEFFMMKTKEFWRMDCEWECDWVAGEGFDEIGRSIKAHTKIWEIFEEVMRVEAWILMRNGGVSLLNCGVDLDLCRIDSIELISSSKNFNSPIYGQILW